MPDSIYPFVWTLSGQALPFGVPDRAACAMAGATAGAVIQPGSVPLAGTWKRHAVRAGSASLVPRPGGIAALAGVSCDPQPGLGGSTVLAVSSGYDGGWRVLDGGRLEPPVLADGWMMAWPPGDAGRPRLYLPALAQLAGLLLTVVIVGGALLRARSADASLRGDFGAL